jgi:hypothetical protein
MKIAFIGLGNMGGGMAANLVKAGHEVSAFDLSPEALARAKASGCAAFAHRAEAVEGVDAVVSMLPNGKPSWTRLWMRMCIGKAPAGRAAARLLDHRCGHRARGWRRPQRPGYAMVDAPVSGGIAAANARHADLHGRRHRRCLRAGRTDPCRNGQGRDPRRNQRGGAGGQAVQQHAAGDPHDRHLRGFRHGAEARPRSADLLRYQLVSRHRARTGR